MIPRKKNKTTVEGFTCVNGLPVAMSSEQAKAMSDDARYMRIMNSPGDPTPAEKAWFRDIWIQYVAQIAVYTDYYTAFINHGKRQGERSSAQWYTCLCTLKEEELDIEALRIVTLYVTEVDPWLAEQRREQKEVE